MRRRHQNRIDVRIHTLIVVVVRPILVYLAYFDVITSQVEFVIQVIEKVDSPFFICQIDIVVDIIVLVD
jgi:hypothetical protein